MVTQTRTESNARKTGETARDIAVSVLARLINARAASPPPVQSALDSALRKAHLDERDRALCTELVYGTLRSVNRLDWVLDRMLTAPDKLPPRIRLIMLSAAYALLFLDRIPAHATVNWAVEATSRHAGKGLARVTNAVLRSIGRQKTELCDEAWYVSNEPDLTRRISALYSIPEWLVGFWLATYGESRCRAYAAAMLRTPWTGVRLNQKDEAYQKFSHELKDMDALPIGYAGFLFRPGAWPESLREDWQNGRLSWQGAGSQRMLEALDARSWEGPIWDACCGHGGKTCALLEMGHKVLLASDPNARRLEGLRSELARLALPRPELRTGTVQDLTPSFEPRTIVLDVPCSGLGTLSRRPDIRLHNGLERMQALCVEQREILEAAWNVLPAQGRIVYMTCTIAPMENEGQMQAFMARHEDAQHVMEYTSVPDDTGADIMYGCVVRKVTQ